MVVSVGINVGFFAVMSLLLIMRYRLKRREYELEITALKEVEDKNLRIEQKAQLERVAEENKRRELEAM